MEDSLVREEGAKRLAGDEVVHHRGYIETAEGEICERCLAEEREMERLRKEAQLAEQRRREALVAELREREKRLALVGDVSSPNLS